MPATSITIILSPYHRWPNRIRALGLVSSLEKLGIKVDIDEIPPVDDFEGEIGRSFNSLRLTSLTVSQARSNNSFPFILSGNCMASVGAACGLGLKDLNFIYFDAHDDTDTLSTNQNSYFDAMVLKQIPGYAPMKYDKKFLYVGLRDVNEVQRKTVQEAGADVIWGDAEKVVDFPGELQKRLEERDMSPSLVHLDLDVLDKSVGVVNGFESEGGLQEEDVVKCMSLLPKKAIPVSFTMCSFNPNLGDGDEIAGIGIRAAVAFVESLIAEKVLSAQS
ncbi:unnamed protein product [Alternaria alternata]